MPSSWKTYSLICLLLIGGPATAWTQSDYAWTQSETGESVIYKAPMESTSHPLHGHYEALSLDRDFTFWNSGRFESRYTGSCLEEHRNGQGTYEIEDGLLKLQFEAVEVEPENNQDGEEASGDDQSSEGSIQWESRHFEQLVVQLGGSETIGQIDYFMVHRPRNEEGVEKMVPNDVPAKCGTPEWDCWRRNSEFLPFEEVK